MEGFKIRQVPEPLVVKRSLHDLNGKFIIPKQSTRLMSSSLYLGQIDRS